MNRFQQILGMAVALGGFAPPRLDYPYLPQESVSRRRGKVGAIPGFVNCHCAKCDSDDEPLDPDDTAYPAGKKHLYRTVEAPKGKRTTRAQRKAQNAKGKS